jgi:hypothetical protein
MRYPLGCGTLGRLANPEWIAIDADHLSVGWERGCENLGPMADPATDVKHLSHLIEGKTTPDQLNVVPVPPIVAGVTEIFGRV